MSRAPAFQFYVDDFIGGACDLSAEETGAYIRLLCYQWGRGSIPTDAPDKLERVAGCKVSADVLARFPDGRNARLEREREKQEAFREIQRRKGLASGRARTNPGSTPVQPRFNPGSTEPPTESQPEGNSPSPSPSPIREDIHTHSKGAFAEIPSWAEVKTLADARGYPEASAKAFFDHHQGNALWINQHGKIIDWPHKLQVWAVNDRQNPRHHAKHSPSNRAGVDRNAGTLNKANGRYDRLVK